MASLLQSKTVNGGGYVNAVTATFTSNVTAGSLIVVAVTSDDINTIASIVSTSNTVILIDSAVSDDRKTWLYYIQNATASSNSVVVTMGSGEYTDVVVTMQEWDGMLTTGVFDQTAKGNSGGSYVNTLSTSATSTTTQANELVIVAGGSGGSSPAYSAGSGYSNLISQGGFDSYTSGFMESKIVSSTGAQTGVINTTSYVRMQAIVATFKLGTLTAPATPTGVSATAGNTVVAINWPAVSGATSYEVRVSLTSGSGFIIAGTPTSNTFLDTGKTNGVTYYYKVAAVNSAGTSGYSSEVSGIPAATYTYDWHPYGTKPNLTTSQLRSYVRTFYDNWMAYCLKSDGMPGGMPAGAKRIAVPDQVIYPATTTNSTVSEGMGYGLALSAWFSNPDLGTGVYDPSAKANFDALWTYYNYFKNSNGLMGWSISASGTQLDAGGATDGDLDAAIGLVIMSRIHGNSGSLNYGSLATSLINAIRDHEFVPEDYATTSYRNLMMNGDLWGAAADNYMSDYFRAAWMREFRYHTSDDRWDRILAKNYPHALQYWYDNYLGGVVPDRQRRNNTMVVEDYGSWPLVATYNSVRLSFGVMTDYLWNGSTADALGLNMMNKQANRAKALYTTGSAVNAPNYTLDGVSTEDYANGSALGMFGPAALGSSGNQTFATEIYNAMAASSDQNNSYFNGGVCLMGMIVMSGIAQPLRSGTAPITNLFNSQLLIND